MTCPNCKSLAEQLKRREELIDGFEEVLEDKDRTINMLRKDKNVKETQRVFSAGRRAVEGVLREKEEVEKLVEILFKEIKMDCDKCHAKDECEHDDCSALMEFYKKVAKQEMENGS